jgi:hypothetical protein
VTQAASFLGGAHGRLLPASIPFRYFAAAVFFHCAAWAMLLAGAGGLGDFEGGLGLPLAAVHLLTIGVLTITAMGASFQLLPVATVQPLGRLWPSRLAFWLAAPGVVVLVYGLAVGAVSALLAGGAAVVGALLVFSAVIAENLWRARSMPLVAAHGWAALGSLLAILILAGLLAGNHTLELLDDHQAAAVAHFHLAAFGFMGLLALGFSYVLVPMFALSRPPEPRFGWASLALAMIGLALTASGALMRMAELQGLAAVSGLGAVVLHLEAMRRVWASRMRKRMGLSFVLVRIAWIMLAASLGLGLALAAGVAIRAGTTLFGLLVLVGWLLTFLLGILQRILPFLASMHFGKAHRRPPLVSELTPELPLKTHAACHLAALVLLAAGIVMGSSRIVQAGAATGLVGSLAFAYFTAEVFRRLPDGQALPQRSAS